MGMNSNINGNYAIAEDGTISITLPAVQKYASKSFGVGANMMVAVTKDKDDYFLPFKNLCGYLKLKLYGIEREFAVQRNIWFCKRRRETRFLGHTLQHHSFGDNALAEPCTNYRLPHTTRATSTLWSVC